MSSKAWPKGLIISHRLSGRLFRVMHDHTFDTSGIYTKTVTCRALNPKQEWCPHSKQYVEQVWNYYRHELEIMSDIVQCMFRTEFE